MADKEKAAPKRVTIELGRKTREVKYSITDTEEIERQTGKMLGEVVRDLSRTANVRDAVTCLTIGLASSGDKTLTRGRVISLLEKDLAADRITMKTVIEAIIDGLNASTVFRGIVAEMGGGDEEDADDDEKKDDGSATGSATPSATHTNDSD